MPARPSSRRPPTLLPVTVCVPAQVTLGIQLSRVRFDNVDISLRAIWDDSDDNDDDED